MKHVDLITDIWFKRGETDVRGRPEENPVEMSDAEADRVIGAGLGIAVAEPEPITDSPDD